MTGRHVVTYNAGACGNADHVELTKLTFNKDTDGYYLSAKFTVEDKNSIREVDIPKIRLRIDSDRVTLKSEYNPRACTQDMWADLGFGYMPLASTEVDGVKVMYTEKVLEEKTHEMTLDEIEKKLGYKVKIVNKKDVESTWRAEYTKELILTEHGDNDEEEE